MILNLIKEIKEDIKNITYSRKNLFFFTIAISVLISIYLWKISLLKYALFLVIPIILSILLPKIIYPIYYIFTIIAIVIGKIISSLILTIIFYIILTPIGILKRTRNPSIKTDFSDKEETYWTNRDKDDYNFKNQF